MRKKHYIKLMVIVTALIYSQVCSPALNLSINGNTIILALN